MPDLFNMRTPPNPDLLYRRNDPNDVRLGEVVMTEAGQYADAGVVILGCPQDEGVRRNKGRVGAKDAPDAIRRCLYRLVEIEKLKLFDLGNTIVQDTLEATHDIHRDIVRRVLRDGKRLVVLGGGNDISYPDCSALAMESAGDILAFNIDAHFDVRADEPRNSGTPYRQLLEEGHIKPENFYIMGYQPFANSPAYVRYFESKGTALSNLFSIHDIYSLGFPFLQEKMMSRPEHKNMPVFIGLDMDVVSASDAPGVSAPNPTGLPASLVCHMAAVIGEYAQTRIFEIAEVNPVYDIDERTCRLAAALIWYFLLAFTQKAGQ